MSWLATFLLCWLGLATITALVVVKAVLPRAIIQENEAQERENDT